MKTFRRKFIKEFIISPELLIIAILALMVVMPSISPLRFDFASGVHMITPTAIDTDIWGNYKVYFKTNEFTNNKNEDYYYIDKDRKDLVEIVELVIMKHGDILAYYDKYVGWQGFTSPRSSPIVRVERIRESFKDISYKALSI